MRKRELIWSGLAIGLPTAQPIYAQTQQPNIVFIITDQQRADAIGCAGNKAVITPNIDRLAAEGYLFRNAYSSTPSSTPARAGLLTGLAPWHHGMLGYGNVAEHYRYEMPQLLRDQGYLTLGIGKMHWKPQQALHGFHATILDESGRCESPYFMSDYRKWFHTVALGEDPDATGLGWNDHGAAPYQLPEKLHPTTWTADVAIRTIEHYQANQPLFLTISFARPHSPYDPPQRILDRYQDVAIPAAATGAWSSDIGAELTDPQKNPSASFAQFYETYVKNTRKHYYASITYIDEQVGRIVAALKERGMYENTLICFTSDHGDMMGDHHHWRKSYAYEGSSAIPLILKLPRETAHIRQPSETIDNPVELRDILPTFLVTSGGSVPEGMDGSSLLRLITEEKPTWRRWIDLEHATCYTDENYWCALTDGKMKYIWFFHSGKEQLFDLERDPQETRELSTHKQYQKELKTLRAALVEHLRERGTEWVKENQLMIRKESLLYSPNYPKKQATKKDK